MSVTETFSGMIQRTNDAFIRDNIYMVGKGLLARALKTVDPQSQDKILRNMTGDGADEVKRLMDSLGEISNEDSEAAQKEIMSMAQGYV